MLTFSAESAIIESLIELRLRNNNDSKMVVDDLVGF